MTLTNVYGWKKKKICFLKRDASSGSIGLSCVMSLPKILEPSVSADLFELSPRCYAHSWSTNKLGFGFRWAWFIRALQ